MLPESIAVSNAASAYLGGGTRLERPCPNHSVIVVAEDAEVGAWIRSKGLEHTSQAEINVTRRDESDFGRRCRGLVTENELSDLLNLR